MLLANLTKAVENTGTFTFLPADHRCNSTQDCDWHMGAVKVTLSSDHPSDVG